MENIRSQRSPIELIGLGLFALAFFAIIVFGGEKIVLLLYGLCGAAAIFYVAYRYHWLMIVLWGLSTQMMVEMVIWDYSKYVEPSMNIGGGIDMLYGDPVLFGMISAMFVKLFSGDFRARYTLFRENWFWTAFMLWMLFELARSMMMFGIVSPIGEFRTYFREILIVPYIVMFARTRRDQWRLFNVLLVLTLAFIGIGLFRGAYVHGFAFSAYSKWLYQHGSLALVWGTVALFAMHRYGYWRFSNMWFAGLVAVSMGLTVIASHRSVWLAAMVAILVLFFMGHLKLGNLIKLGLAGIVAAFVIDVVYDDIDLIAFVQERLVALTSPREDTTANWRYLIWLDALEQSKAFLLEGKGLGNYFQVRAPNGAIVTTMLHNQYIQLIYQVGIIGLVLYLGFYFQTLSRLRRVYRETVDPLHQMIVLTATVVLISAGAYYIAYDFEPFTWLFVGLGLAAVQTHVSEREAAHEYFRAMYAIQHT